MTQPEAQTDWPLVSVIIPVLNDEAGLACCLAALAQQTYPRSRFDIIVIDNGSDQMEGLQRLAVAYHITLIQELAPGAYTARNAGIALATGEIIAFTDADCIPAPDWLERGVAYFEQDPNCGLVVGDVTVFPQDSRQPTLLELYQMVTAFPQEHHLKQYRGGATANVLTRRQVIEQVGAFDPTLKSYGDFEWGRRVFLAGYGQVYGGDVQICHPARSSWRAFVQRTRRDAGGFFDYFVRAESRWLHRQLACARLVLLDLVPPVNFALATLKDVRLRGLGQRLGVPGVLLWVRYISAWEKLRLWVGGQSIRG